MKCLVYSIALSNVYPILGFWNRKWGSRNKIVLIELQLCDIKPDIYVTTGMN